MSDIIDEDFRAVGTHEEVRRTEMFLENLRLLLDTFQQGGAIPGALQAGTAEVTLQGSVLTVRMQLPANAVYSSTPPQFPQAGVYCFPSGNFKPTSDLGWRLRATASHRRIKTNVRARHICLKCRLCGTSFTTKIDSLLTTLIVDTPADGSARHEH